LGDGFEEEHFVVICLVEVVVIVGDVKEEGIRRTVWSHRDAIELDQGDAPPEIILVFEMNELFHEGFDDAAIFGDVEDGLVGEYEYSFLAFPLSVELEYPAGEDNLFVTMKQAAKPLLLSQVQ
jgi:hypothetical protein